MHEFPSTPSASRERDFVLCPVRSRIDGIIVARGLSKVSVPSKQGPWLFLRRVYQPGRTIPKTAAKPNRSKRGDGLEGKKPLNHVHALFLHGPTVHPALTKPMTTESRPEASSDWAAPEDEEIPACQIAARLDSEFNGLDSERIEGACKPQQKSRSGLTNDLSPRYPSRLAPWCQKPMMTFFLLHVTYFFLYFTPYIKFLRMQPAG